MKPIISIIGIIFFAGSLLASELVVLETYSRDDWISFADYNGLNCFLDSSGALYAKYALSREGEWTQGIIRCYPPGEEARGGDLTGWGPGGWWLSRISRVAGDQLEVTRVMGTDFMPMPVQHSLVTINHSAELARSVQHTKLSIDTQIWNIRKTSDTTASGFCSYELIDSTSQFSSGINFIKDFQLFEENQYNPADLLKGDTLWSSSPDQDDYYVIDSRLNHSNIMSALYPNTPRTKWAYVCLDDEGVLFEIDSLFSGDIQDLGLRALDSLFIFTWRAGADLFLSNHNPYSNQLSAPEAYYTGLDGNLASTSHARMVMDDDYIYLQMPVLRDYSSSAPSNWRSIIRHTISREDYSITATDTVISYQDSPGFATHAIAVKDGAVHSLIATEQGPDSYLYYYGDLNLVSIEPDPVQPKQFDLSAGYPNPFNGSITFDLEVPVQMDIQLQVYDLKGKLVYHEESSHFSSGTHQIHWSGENIAGKELASGIYLIQLRGNGSAVSQKLVLLK